MSDEQPTAPTLDLGDLRLRPLRPGDAAALHACLRVPRVTERTSYPEVTPALAEAIIDKATRRWAAGEPAKWAVTLAADDSLIGTCGFNEWSEPHRWAELAYDLASAHWGRGLMRRSVDAALRWIFDQGSVDRVQAYVRVDNERSQRLLARAGFRCEGQLRRFRVCRGVPHDFSVYGLLREEWVPAGMPDMPSTPRRAARAPGLG